VTVGAWGPGEGSLSLRHLQAELARLDVLIRREVWRWQAAGQDASDDFRGLYVSDGEANALLARPFGTSWGQMVPLDGPQAEAFAFAGAEAERQAAALVEEARQQGASLHLQHLGSAFGLDRFDVDSLLIALAPALDLAYERLYGYLQDDVTRKQPTVNLVLNLLCDPGVERLGMLRRFADDAPLLRFELLERVSEPGRGRSSLLSQTLFPDPAIVSWLLGKYLPHADLGADAELLRPEENGTDSLLGSGVAARLERVVDEQPVVVFYGPDQAGQLATARLLTARIERPLLKVNLAGVTQRDLSSLRALRLALRDARLTGAVPFLTNWDACLEADGPPPSLVGELCDYPDLVIVGGEASWHPRGMERERKLLSIEFPIPAYTQRRALWSHFLGSEVPSDGRERELGLVALAGQFLLTSGQIRDAVASARDMAGARAAAVNRQDLFSSARIHSSPRLAGLARKIVPRYGWGDIVLPTDQLALLGEIIDTVRERPVVLEEWGVGRKLASSRGVTILFAGEPGTGKTMAAEIIAAELGLDLYKIDLSTVVSKYIGETEKNLERIFSEAQNSNAILFFDEADAIFGKRSEVKDAHDRYANIEISYLLQRMELYDGVTVLATNLRANLDEAFTRRLQFAVDFPFPEEDDRLRIWEALFPPGVPRHPDIDFSLLANRFKLAGGNIRNIIVSAAYLAASERENGTSESDEHLGQVTMHHLLHGTRRELQKMGRLVRKEQLSVD
jgi:AAA+ superfamily predicted ATPase